ncbi:hypothetical protein J2Y45_003143 [Dyadobacter sp. BE34]|uniref:Uncharacterized protein n=1 Tax=Dyadobacter fermentans TaxID=94254 RepID=A0ABU1QXT4_9BACT|nr:hypothetical protein [Dyadobacter fermentans]MDR7043691.1 hypothetical protein [Dyadobacter sp. BE242]MDR7198003.1 hypothetical protein [Dyadobacter sp. BE34]MDR7215965.1 hypothetical protein [Dyadobacter sp. BE31]MDR7264509.1 hypothetical protein [Dyadobacter sp. BE32]
MIVSIIISVTIMTPTLSDFGQRSAVKILASSGVKKWHGFIELSF